MSVAISCTGCMWNGDCTYGPPCEYYEASYEDDDSYVIENNRYEFLREWWEYVEE